MWKNIQRETFEKKEKVYVKGCGYGSVIATDSREWHSNGAVKASKTFTVKMKGGKIRHGIKRSNLIWE